MSDDEFLAALESCSLIERDFGHAAHARAAYLYLRSGDFAAALAKTRSAIRAYAASLGNADRYHETITAAYLRLIAQFLAGCPREMPFDSRVEALLGSALAQPDFLLRFYSREVLMTARARKRWVEPDLAPLPT